MFRKTVTYAFHEHEVEEKEHQDRYKKKKKVVKTTHYHGWQFLSFKIQRTDWALVRHKAA